MRFLKRWGVKTKKHTAFAADLTPEAPLFIIGDIHGRIDLLDRLLASAPENVQLVFVGDLVDRGENSALVLARVRDLCALGAICLMGNHEKMMLDFLNRPTERGPTWLRNGGLQTLQSYGVRGVRERASEADLLVACDKLQVALPDGMARWIEDLPLHYSNGNIHVVHAAADPALDMAEQTPDVLLWGTSAFRERPRSDGQWVVHGHTIVDEGMAKNGRISIDTGAYATGVLTGIYISQSKGEFIFT
jgi:serine/threonine protein phosphatase 1